MNKLIYIFIIIFCIILSSFLSFIQCFSSNKPAGLLADSQYSECLPSLVVFSEIMKDMLSVSDSKTSGNHNGRNRRKKDVPFVLVSSIAKRTISGAVLILNLLVFLLAKCTVYKISRRNEEDIFRRILNFYRWWSLKFIPPVFKIIDAMFKDSDAGYSSGFPGFKGPHFVHEKMAECGFFLCNCYES
jgi:hypothetical protein